MIMDSAWVTPCWWYAPPGQHAPSRTLHSIWQAEILKLGTFTEQDCHQSAGETQLGPHAGGLWVCSRHVNEKE